MTDRLDAVAVSGLVRRTYLSYLLTLLPLQDPVIEMALQRAIGEEGALVTGPLLEASPPYVIGASVSDLIAEGLIDSSLRVLDRFGLPVDRPLYRHQEAAVRKVIAGRNVVVATGTGSGKTESFLLPILHHLARERAAGTLVEPGVRALLLYPMNALANDQMKRLRSLLNAMPDIRFGRYIGETEATPDRARDKFERQFPGLVPPPNELLSRSEMQAQPPHLLITNYAMLEYLLLRPLDHALFDGDTGRRWRFLVLDEAHVYDGTQGIEVGMLIRRLHDRVARERSLRYIATSATVGGSDAGPEVAAFAAALFDAEFEYDPADADRQDVVWADRRGLDDRVGWGPLPDDAYEALLGADDRLAQLRMYPGAPASASSPAVALAAEARVRRLQELLREGPCALSEIADLLFDGDALRRTAALVALAACTHDGDDQSLIPARYHLWARAAEGAFVCLAGSEPHVWLTRREICGVCAAACFEVGSCKRCSATYLTGTIRDGKLFPRSARDDRPGWLLLTDDDGPLVATSDEDDETLEGTGELSGALTSCWLCTGCGRLHTTPVPACTPGCGSSRFRPAAELPSHALTLTSCPRCGGRSRSGQVRLFESGTDAAVAVLSTALYQALPPDPMPQMAEKRGQGRKLLLFSDSRQDAAFFAPYLDSTYAALVRRRCVLEGLSKVTRHEDVVLLGDLVDACVRVGEGHGLFTFADTRVRKLAEAGAWVHAELLTVVAANSLEGLGMLAFGLRRNPAWQPPSALLELGLARDEAWAFVEELLRTLRGQGAVTFPPGVAPDDQVFEPRLGPVFVRKEGPEPRRKVLSWLPGRGTNTRVAYVAKVLSALDVDGVQASTVAEGLWRWLTQGPAQALLHHTSDAVRGAVYQLNHELISVRTVDEARPVYRCDRCQRVAPLSVRGVCTTLACGGRLESWAPPRAEVDGNHHYRQLARSLQPRAAASSRAHRTVDPDRGRRHPAAVPRRGRQRAVVFDDVRTGRRRRRAAGGRAPQCATIDCELCAAGRPCRSSYRLRRTRSDVRAAPQPRPNVLRRPAGDDQRPGAVAANHDGKRADCPPPCVLDRLSRLLPRRAGGTGPGLPHRRLPVQRGTRRRLPRGRRADRLPSQAPDGDHGGGAACRSPGPPRRRGLGGPQLGGGSPRACRDHRRASPRRHPHLSRAGAAGERGREVPGGAVVSVNTLEGRYLLAYLAAHNILPKYGFPFDTVQLETAHVQVPEARQLSLDRDLRLAIFDYAPGNEVVAGGWVWKSAGVRRLPERELESRFFASCSCGMYVEAITDPEIIECPACGLSGRHAPKVRRYVVPEFGFIASRKDPRRPTTKPLRTYSGRVYLADEEPESEPEVVGLSGGARLELRHVERGRLVVINAGPFGRGYYLCDWCGAGEPVQGRGSRTHENPRRGGTCTGPVRAVCLGHRFETDVLSLRLRNAGVPTDAKVWWSLLYALIEGASSELQIARDDLDGTLFYGSFGPPALVLFDDVPGGAGHVRRIARMMLAVLQAAHRRVSSCECGPETSCYRCLRSFRNQPHHDDLRRGPVADLLQAVCGKILTGGASPTVPGEVGAVETAIIASENGVIRLTDGREFVRVRGHDLFQLDGRAVLARANGRLLAGMLWVEADEQAAPLRVIVGSGPDALVAQPDAIEIIGVRRLPTGP